MDAVNLDKSHHRQALRQLSFPEKVKKVIELQRIAAPILQARGHMVRIWPDEDADVMRISQRIREAF